MVCAYSQSDKINWMGRIRQKANERREMLGISKPPETAAVWIPNSGAKTCMCCKKYEFSVIRRRHHCRKCGIVVCGPCSTNKIVIENMNQEQSMRVCLNCFKQSLMKDQRPEQTSTQHDEESEEAEATFYK
ncbi:hypothetical protein HZS_6109 [Henneguya salminicola]|nr:hypothetical protein HZS_6109 [Henneguya salminicola]